MQKIPDFIARLDHLLNSPIERKGGKVQNVMRSQISVVQVLNHPLHAQGVISIPFSSK